VYQLLSVTVVQEAVEAVVLEAAAQAEQVATALFTFTTKEN
jgi:hypothetical protein